MWSVMPCSASRTMILPVRAEAAPHDAAQVVAGHVLAHAVELEARRPRLRHRRPDRRVLELAGQRAVGHDLDPRVHEQLERLGDDGLPLGQAQRVAGDGDQRPDLVHAPARRSAGCSGACTVSPAASFVIGTRTGAPSRSGTRSSRTKVDDPAVGGELDLDVEPVALLGPGEQPVARRRQPQPARGEEVGRPRRAAAGRRRTGTSRCRRRPGPGPTAARSRRARSGPSG